MGMIEKHYKSWLTALKRKHVAPRIILITATLTKNKLSWIPKFGPKIKREIEMFGFSVAFPTGPNLKHISCKSKDNLIPNSYSGVYELKCSCGSVYNGETKKNHY